MKTDKGIDQFIQDNPAQTEGEGFDRQKYLDMIDEMAKLWDSTPKLKRGIHMFGDTVLKYRKALGDEGFKQMLYSCEITTDSKGVKHIEEFCNEKGIEINDR